MENFQRALRGPSSEKDFTQTRECSKYRYPQFLDKTFEKGEGDERIQRFDKIDEQACFHGKKWYVFNKNLLLRRLSK